MAAGHDIREKHELGFADFDVRVEVEEKGAVWISFHDSTQCLLTMQWHDLREVVDFAARHGLRMDAPYIVEKREAEEAGLT